MMRRDRHDEQVDPFNAGEPSLPWDEPHAFDDIADGDHDADACVLDEGQYTSPTKHRDAYRAPQTDPDPAAPEPAETPVTAPAAPAAPKSRAERRHRRTRRSAGDAPESASASAGRRRGGRRVLKFLVLFFIAFNVVPLLVSCAVEVFIDTSFDANDSDYTPPSFSSDDDEPLPEPDFAEPPSNDPPASDTNADLQSCLDAVGARLAAFTPDNESARALIVEGLTEEIEFFFDRSPEDLGMDVDAAARTMIERSSFAVNADSSATLSDGSGWVGVDAVCPPVFEVGTELNGTLSEYLIDNDLYGSSKPLTEEQKAMANELLMDAVKSVEVGQNSRSIDVTQTDGSWTIDEEDWTEAIRNLYGIYL